MAADFNLWWCLRSSTMRAFRPPFVVPPNELNLWDTDFEHEYNIWEGKNKSTTNEDKNKTTNKEDYRQYIIDLNNEFDMEEAFNKMDAAVAAIDTLIACKKRFQNCDLNEDLDRMYDAQDMPIYLQIYEAIGNI